MISSAAGRKARCSYGGDSCSARLAWRCIESRPGSRIRFAHTGPWHITQPNAPLRPRRAEAEWLVQRVKEEIQRSESIAPPSLIEDYRRSLARYEELLRQAR